MPGTIFRYEPEKLEELVLYVATKSADDPNFGKTKLNKILYYVDFMAYANLGTPVTGATYQRRPYGPVPREILQATRTLLDRGDAEIAMVERFGYPQKRLVASRPPNLSLFTQQQMRLINQVVQALRGWNGVEVSELSHREVGWQVTEDRDVIPYETVFLSSRQITDDIIRRGQEIYATIGPES